MFIGHYALAFGAKRVAPMMSLGTLFLACQFADLLWPTLLVLGLEVVQIDPGNTVVTPLNFVSYPYSHSFVALVGWSALFALAYFYVLSTHSVVSGRYALPLVPLLCVFTSVAALAIVQAFTRLSALKRPVWPPVLTGAAVALLTWAAIVDTIGWIEGLKRPDTPSTPGPTLPRLENLAT